MKRLSWSTGEGGVAVDVVGGECDLYRACAGERLQSVADGVGIGGAAVYLDVEFGNEH